MRSRTPKTLWKADNAQTFRKQLAQTKIEVPLRTQGRTKDHTEIYAMAHLLSTLSADYFKFPVEVIHRERPDFVVNTRGRAIGIEHIEAIPQSEAYMAKLREEGHGPDVHFLRHASVDEPVKSRQDTIDEIEADEDGDGWVGDGAEQEWAQAMAHFIKKKIDRVDQPGFESFGETWLLIYDNWPVPSVDPRKASRFLLGTDGMAEALARFRRIFVMDGQRIWEFSTDASFHSLVRPNDLDQLRRTALKTSTALFVGVIALVAIVCFGKR